MRKSRFTEEQIIGMIKEQEAGLPTVEVCRKHGLSPATFYKLKAKYGGLEVSDARRLRQLEDENGKAFVLAGQICLRRRGQICRPILCQSFAQRGLADPQIGCNPLTRQAAGQRNAHGLPLELF